MNARLAALPRRIEPPADLWPGIAAGMDTVVDRRRPAGGLVRRFALVATVALATGFTLWIGAGLAPDELLEDGVLPRTGQVYANNIELIYAGPLRTLASDRRPAAPVLDTGAIELSLRTLEEAADEIRAAIEANPEAVYLAELLENTHRQRIRMLRDLALLGVDEPAGRRT
ncbi:MAG: hypothetical protein AAGE01_09785 [Pseudomonadota bacterium]